MFNRTIDHYNGPPVSFQLDPTVRPIRLKACQVPFALKPKIDEELHHFINQRFFKSWDVGDTHSHLSKAKYICADYKSTFKKFCRTMHIQSLLLATSSSG